MVIDRHEGSGSPSWRRTFVWTVAMAGLAIAVAGWKTPPVAVGANNIDSMGLGNMPLVIGPIKEGKLKALGVTSLERSELLPDVPTLDELGLKGYEVNAWGGYVAPAGTPPEIVARLNAELIRILRSENAMQARIGQGFELVPPLTPAEFGKMIADDLAHWVPLVRMSGARAD